MKTLYHLARRADWHKAQATGVYTTSTLGKTLEEVGFIHLSFAPQVKIVADVFYRDIPDLVLLTIDPAKLTAEVKVEAGAGTVEQFPHLYGPLSVAAVSGVSDYELLQNDEFPEVRES
jgi:glutathione S-transferase